MGKILSVASRKVQRFNVENRAHRIISQEKPTPAPKFPQTIEELERIAKENPEIVEEQMKKDQALDNRLREVYVVSEDPIEADKERQHDSSRPLPLNRRRESMPEYGMTEPSGVAKGNFTLRQALKFITDHQGDPKLWNVERIVTEYNTEKESTEKILKYFRTFEVYIPTLPEGGKPSLVAKQAERKEIEK